MAGRIFLSFAEEDKKYREFLLVPARNHNRPFEFIDMTPKQAQDARWKERCRRTIQECDGLIALLSWKTLVAPGARWEMQCAREARVPMIGVHIERERRPTVPGELAGGRVVEWSWEEIAEFLNSLRADAGAGHHAA